MHHPHRMQHDRCLQDMIGRLLLYIPRRQHVEGRNETPSKAPVRVSFSVRTIAVLLHHDIAIGRVGVSADSNDTNLWKQESSSFHSGSLDQSFIPLHDILVSLLPVQ